MVTLLGLLQHGQILREHLLLGKGDTIEALHLVLGGIATPEGTRHAHQLHGLDNAGREDVRTLTEVSETALRIGGDGTILEILLDVFHLVSLAGSLELCDAVGLAHLLAHHSLVPAGQLDHLVLNGLEVALTYLLAIRKQHVIEEAILHGRSETELNAGIELLQSFSEQVGTGMPKGMLALFILKLVEMDGGILMDRTVELRSLTVHATCHYILCQTTGDALGYLQPGHSGFIFSYRTIGKSNLYHSHFLNVFLLLFHFGRKSTAFFSFHQTYSCELGEQSTLFEQKAQ